MTLLLAGPNFSNLLNLAVMLLIAILVVGLFYYIINQKYIPLPPPLTGILNVLLVVAAIIGIIVYFLLPMVK